MSVEQVPEWYPFEDKRPEWLKGKSGMLSDRDIRRCLEEEIIRIEPFPNLKTSLRNSCKIDFHFGNVVTIPKKSQITVIRSGEKIPEELLEVIDIKDGEEFVIHPGDFILAQTKERLVLPDFMAARMEGKSSIARIGIVVQLAAIFDAGWDGIPTMELKHNGIVAKTFIPGDEICAFSFELLTTPAMNIYSGRYQGQTQPKI